ncbi:MAG: hypothetical protein IJ530_09230 [Treponema sp.]|uniref:hypothetical protein n=1 Tax=Treponema sp. TaxID=166 RepID=UPI0025FF7055|nr:hypothetical protein [Treponema sp.]MBQ8679937.1 hypothetical protein [Treponema sp.]
MKNIIIFAFMIESFVCFANETKNRFNYHDIKIGDDISLLCANCETDTFVLCGSSKIYPCITVQDGLEYYIVAFSNNKIIAIFYSSVYIKGKKIIAGKTTVQELEELKIKYEIFKESGFGYIFKLDDFDFIVSIGDSGTDRLPVKTDLITSIVKR